MSYCAFAFHCFNSFRGILTLFLFTFSLNRGVTVHIFVLNRNCLQKYNLYFSGNSNDKWCLDSLWSGVTDRCVNESRFWDGSGINIDWSGYDQLRFSCPSRDAPQTCTSFNVNKHDWTSHTSCNHSISVSTAERHQQITVEITRHVAFHLPQQVISVHSSLVH